MANVQKIGDQLDFDADGFLIDPHTWTPDTAAQIAEEDGLSSLTTGHWDIIHYLREHYLKFGTLPVMSHVCRVSHMEADCVYVLFHNSREAWRIAGLPNPGEEAKSYM